ncbi:hypothetical protein FJY71_01005 [candidate division WOR-3 bacterium]|nr:hypothetical protein [candidate division WOR-3 bacterium]
MRAILLAACLVPISLAATDVGVRATLAPIYVDTGAVVAPRAAWRNYGAESTAFTAWAKLVRHPDSLAYEESLVVEPLPPAADTVLTFPGFYVGAETATWYMRCSTCAPADTNPANDVLEDTFHVKARRPI